MDKGKRICVFAILSILLLGIFYFFKGKLLPSDNIGIIIFTSLLMLSFSTLLVEHLFTKPSDTIASSISILLLILPLKESMLRFGSLYNILIIYNFAIILNAIISLYLVDKNKPEDSISNKIAYTLKDFSTRFGSGKFLYFILFLFTLIYYIDVKSLYFLILLIYSIVIFLVEPQHGVLKYIKLFNGYGKNDRKGIGNIFCVQSKNTFLAKVYNDVSFNEFDVIQFNNVDNGRKKTYEGMIFQKYFLDEQQWIKVLQLDEITYNKELNINVIYKNISSNNIMLKNKFIGIVDAMSTINKVKFIYNSKIEIIEGTLLHITQGNNDILYQVIEAITKIECLESKNETGYIVGEAVQIGIWNIGRKTFEKYGWVPEVNTPVYLAKNIEQVDIEKNEYMVGNIPNTNFPVIINKEIAISHHLGIFGATGCGKSVFTRSLIRKIIEDGIKIICVDFTNEYIEKFSDLDPINLIDSKEEIKVFTALDVISEEMEKFANQRDKLKIKTQSNGIDDLIKQNLKKFYEGKDKMCILSLPDVSNTSGIVEYTKRFFKVAFQIAKNDKNYSKKVCIIIEEAHTVIPEFSFTGIDEKISRLECPPKFVPVAMLVKK